MAETHRLPSGEHLHLPPTAPEQRFAGLYRHAHGGKPPHTVAMSPEQWVREHCDPSDGLKPLKGEQGWVGLLNPRTKEVYSLSGKLAPPQPPEEKPEPKASGKDPAKPADAPPMGGGKPPA